MYLHNKHVVAGVAVAMALMPVIASAQTTDVQSQIQALLQQIQTLQEQLRALVASSTPIGVQNQWMMGTTTQGVNVPPGQLGKAMCVTLNRNLGVGAQGEDVRNLQQMLMDDSESGYEGGVTGYFGPLTARAMAAFQERFGIASSSTGFVGALTRGFFERECGNGIGENENHSMLPLGAISGTITAVSGSSITIQNAAGTSRVVNVTASTTIQVSTGTSTPPTVGSMADLTVGKTASAQGAPASDGSISAVHINVGFVPAVQAMYGAPMMNGRDDSSSEDHGMGMMNGVRSASTTNDRGERGGFMGFFNPFMPHNSDSNDN